MIAVPQTTDVLPPPRDIATADLRFDRRNPRLFLDGDLDERELLRTLWRDFAVDEVALSIAANGYFTHEPLFAACEGSNYVVIEGNRRLAAVRLLLDDDLRAALRATDLPGITDSRRAELAHLPVIVCEREQVWQYIGFKHVNGPQSWQSYAKAQYVAWVHNELGQPLEEIARQIGDRHATVRRLYRGLMVLRQAEQSRRFIIDDRWKNHFAFSHLYTGLGYPNIQNFLGIDDDASYRQDPVPRERLDALGHLFLWLYGRKSTDTRPLIQSQNPDLRRLDDAMGDDDALVALQHGLPLDVALEIGVGDERLFKGCLLEARQQLQHARGKQLTGDPGDDSTFHIADEIRELAERLLRDMKERRWHERAGRTPHGLDH